MVECTLKLSAKSKMYVDPLKFSAKASKSGTDHLCTGSLANDGQYLAPVDHKATHMGHCREAEWKLHGKVAGGGHSINDNKSCSTWRHKITGQSYVSEVRINDELKASSSLLTCISERINP